MNRAAHRELKKLTNPPSDNRMTEDEWADFMVEHGMLAAHAKVFSAWDYRHTRQPEPKTPNDKAQTPRAND